MKFLKTILYLILSLCLVWGITITLGPTIIGFVLNRSLSENKIRLEGLSISPKLQISALRAEFDFSSNSQPFYGIVRAPKAEIALTSNGWIVRLSSGLMQVNDTINLSSLKASFRTVSITNVNVGQFAVSAPEIAVEGDLELSEVNLSSDLDLSSSDMHNLKFSTQIASILGARNGDSFKFELLSGRLSKFSLMQNWQNQRLDLKLTAETLQAKLIKYGQANIKSFLLEAQNNGSVVKTILTAENLSMADDSFHLEAIEANPSLDLNDLTFQKEIRVQIGQGRFKLAAPNRASGNLKSFGAIVGLHLPKRFVKGVANVSDLEIWNDQVPLFTVPELVMDMTALISKADQRQFVRAQLRAEIPGEKESVFTGVLTSQLSNSRGQDCLVEVCLFSKVAFDFKYEHDDEQLTGRGICPSGQCGDETFDFMVETSNTSKIVMGLTKQKIVNPLALIMFSVGLMQGKEVGLGHKVSY